MPQNQQIRAILAEKGFKPSESTAAVFVPEDPSETVSSGNAVISLWPQPDGRLPGLLLVEYADGWELFFPYSRDYHRTSVSAYVLVPRAIDEWLDS